MDDTPVPPAPARSIKRAFAFNALGTALPVVANIVTIPVLARVLGVEGRGEAAAGTASVLLAAVILTFGIPESLTYFIARFKGVIDYRQLIVSLGLAVFVGLGGILALHVFSTALSGGNAAIRTLIIETSWALIPILCTGILRGIASGLHLWKLVGMERSISALTRATLLLTLAIFGSLDVELAAIIVAYSQCAGAIVYIELLRRQHYGRTAQVTGLFSFASRIWLGTLAGVLLMRLDQVLMTPLSTPSELGLYVIAVSAAEIPLVVNAALRDVVYAADAEHHDETRMGLASRLSTCCVLVIALSIAASAPVVFPILLGDQFGGSIIPLWILLFAAVAGNPASIIATALSARGHPGMRSTALIIATIVNCAAVFVLVPPMGAIGASLAMLLGTLTSSAVLIVSYKYRYAKAILVFYIIRRSDITLLITLIRQAIAMVFGPLLGRILFRGRVR